MGEAGEVGGVFRERGLAGDEGHGEGGGHEEGVGEGEEDDEGGQSRGDFLLVVINESDAEEEVEEGDVSDVDEEEFAGGEFCEPAAVVGVEPGREVDAVGDDFEEEESHEEDGCDCLDDGVTG